MPLCLYKMIYKEDEIIAEMQALAFGNGCVGVVCESAGDRAGKKVFIEFTVPGEKVLAKISKESPSFLKAELIEILKKSPDRADPPCDIFQKCGGCELQHIQINAQRKFKAQMVTDTLRKQSSIKDFETEFIGADIPGFHYRRRVNLHLNEEGQLGFFAHSSNTVIDINYCYIATQRINSAIKDLKPFCKHLAAYIYSIIIEEHRDQVYILLKLKEDLNNPEQFQLPALFTEKFVNFSVTQASRQLITNTKDNIPLGRFSQVNSEANNLLVETVVGLVSTQSVIDLFAGCGNFSVPLAKSAKNVMAVEIDNALVEQGRKTAEEQGLGNVLSFVEASCEKYLKRNYLEGTVIMDPPRSGAKNILHHFNNNNIEKIIYVSCNLPSFCRDIKTLSGYGYKLQKIFLLDMFSQTHHIELVAEITK